MVDVVVEVELDVNVDVLGIGTGLSVDDIKDRGGDNLDRTDLVIISRGGRSNLLTLTFQEVEECWVGHLLKWKVQIKLKVPKNSSHKLNCIHFTKVKVNQTKFC